MHCYPCEISYCSVWLLWRKENKKPEKNTRRKGRASPTNMTLTRSMVLKSNLGTSAGMNPLSIALPLTPCKYPLVHQVDPETREIGSKQMRIINYI